jgi:hypothetical protein
VRCETSTKSIGAMANMYGLEGRETETACVRLIHTAAVSMRLQLSHYLKLDRLL